MRRLSMGLLALSFVFLGCLTPDAGAQTKKQKAGAGPVMKIAGKPEVVMSFSAFTGCSTDQGADVPDTRAYAFRRDDGKVLLFSSNSRNYAAVGDSLDTVSRGSCDKMFVTPKQSANAGDFRGRMWLKAAIEAPDGQIIGFVHNEYHGEDFFPGECDPPRRGPNECWYGSSLLAPSADGGKTFDLPPEGTDEVLATVPFRFEKKQGRVGYMAPYPLSERKGDAKRYMYVFFNAAGGLRGAPKTTISGTPGTCLMRGPDTNPDNWRIWNGKDFAIEVIQPYEEKGPDPAQLRCTTVLPFLFGAVKYVPSIERYVALGSQGRRIVYAYSTDLVTWTKPKLLMRVSAKHKWQEGEPLPMSYFSLLDPTSPSRSFETLEKRPYMYYVEYAKPNAKGKEKRERRMMRIPLSIQ